MEVQNQLKDIQSQLTDIRKSERDLERSVEKRLSEVLEKIHDMSEKLSVEIATLKVMSSIYGAVCGLIPGLLFFLFEALKKHQ